MFNIYSWIYTVGLTINVNNDPIVIMVLTVSKNDNIYENKSYFFILNLIFTI